MLDIFRDSSVQAIGRVVLRHLLLACIYGLIQFGVLVLIQIALEKLFP
jgi:hypothetical protein